MHAFCRGKRGSGSTGFPGLGVGVPQSKQDEVDLGLMMNFVRDKPIGTGVFATLPGVKDTKVELSDGVM